MIIAVIIFAYIGNVFLNRYLNKIMYKKDGHSKLILFWFLPIITTIAFTLKILVNNLEDDNWFTGKHW